MIVLDVGEARLQMGFVVVIDQRDGAGDFAGIHLLPMLDQLGADHVGDGQRAIVIAFLGGHFIELIQQGWREGNTEAGGGLFFHGIFQHRRPQSVILKVAIATVAIATVDWGGKQRTAPRSKARMSGLATGARLCRRPVADAWPGRRSVERIKRIVWRRSAAGFQPRSGTTAQPAFSRQTSFIDAQTTVSWLFPGLVRLLSHPQLPGLALILVLNCYACPACYARCAKPNTPN